MRSNGSHATTNGLRHRLAEFHRIPLLREDDPEWDMGESNWHAVVEHILRYGVAAHLAGNKKYRVFSNMNLHYQPRFPAQYVSPDVMVVAPKVRRPDALRSYRIGRDGPCPRMVAEVLSEETAEDGDLEAKVYIYAMIGVREYILVDETGKWLHQRLLLKRLQPDRTWKNTRDPDGGVTSGLGFRLLWDTDGRLRVIDKKTGRRYTRPDEAEERIRTLEAEVARLRAASPDLGAQRPPIERRPKS
jgi:Uma2 family endonuclease